ncbi:D-amino-acid transaminase [Terrilactibacillus laevilacticus]|uniref:D-amino-acid transaminase n=1 Tax=Terrilactibacillus laevilacticus TaxID=1380157 RepID=UPI0011471C8F|nr:D-amino-acid transaminase [Terrilactibacillus laevilacticus]
MSTILYNDQFVPRKEGKVDIEDRGYQFGDGIYEVFRVYHGKVFLMEWHLDRLQRSIKELYLTLPYPIQQIEKNIYALIEKNGLIEGTVYLQITRGATSRNHLFPTNTNPVLIAYTTHLKREEAVVKDGIKVSLLDDIRWLRCDIKTLNLLGNVLNKEKAHQEGSSEAIQHRGDIVTEGCTSNVFIVKEGVLITHQADHFILNGITRMYVLELATKLGIKIEERQYTINECLQADEVFITSTGAEVTPVIQIKDHLINQGKPGPITKQLFSEFENEIKRMEKVSQ